MGRASIIDAVIDRSVGLNALRPDLRERLLRSQLRDILDMVPVLFAGSIAVSTVLLAVALTNGTFGAMAVWAGTVNAVYLSGFIIRRRVRRRGVSPAVRRIAALSTLIHASLLGALWSVPALLLIAETDHLSRTAMIMGVGTMLCASMIAFAGYPQAMASFLIPLCVGLAYAIFGLGGPVDAWVLGIMVPVFIAVMIMVALRHGSTLVKLRVSEYQVSEKHEIISLLLDEVEDRASDWLWGFDREGRIDRVSAGLMTATGLGEEALTGADMMAFLEAITAPGDPAMRRLRRHCAAQEDFRELVLGIRADGRDIWWSLSGRPAFDETGAYVGYIGSGSDITERRLAERRITALAHHDPLTGLYNRAKFADRLDAALERLAATGTPFAVLFMDLDQFKAVNDRRGHLAGDRLLSAVGRRIRAATGTAGHAARLGGDEFAVILGEDCSPRRCEALARRLIADITAPYAIEGETLRIGVSIGIAMAPQHGRSAEPLLRKADLALYRAKETPASAHLFYHDRMDDKAQRAAG